MKRKYIYFIIISVAVIISSTAYLVNRYFIAKDSVILMLRELNDADWQKRDSAVNYLLNHKELLHDKETTNQVINLLNREISENRRFEGNYSAIELRAKQRGEGYGEYFLDVLDLARNISDKRIIPGLADSINSGRGVWDALARFGDDAVDSTIEIFRTSHNDLKRENSINVLSLINKQHISKESRSKIHQIFLDALKDESQFVKNTAQRALADSP